MSMTKFKGQRKHARVFHGRLKGNSEAHCPNDQSRKGYEEIKWDSSVEYQCPMCGKASLVHKMEVKVFRCPCESMTTKQ